MTFKPRRSRPGRSAAACLLAVLMVVPPGSIPAVWAADAPTVDGFAVGPDRVQIQLSAEAQYTSRVSANPPRLILDLAGVEYRAEGKAFAGKGKYLKGVRASQYRSAPDLVARVVLDLSETIGYQISRNEDGLLVTLGPADGDKDKEAATDTEPDKPAAEEASAAKPAEGLAASGGADLSDVAGQVDAQKTVDAAAVPAVKAGVGETHGMTAQVSPDLPDMASRMDVTQKAEPIPSSKPAAAPERRRAMDNSDIMSRLPHDLVSLDFDNTDIKDVIKLLSAKAKINIIYGPDVSGSLSLHLSDVPFDEAFRTILAMMNLSTSQIGNNILRILTPAALKGTQTAAATATKVITLNYSKPSDILPAVNQIRTAEGRSGTAIANDKTNSLIVTESVEGLPRTELLVAQLDQRPRQVLIETKIVEVSLTKSLDYGVTWSYESADRGKAFGKQGQTLIGTLAPGAVQTQNSFFGSARPNATTQPFNENPQTGAGAGAAGGGTGVSLPQQAFGALTLGRITNNYFINATLMAAAADGKVKVLSDPKIATLNNQPASINVNTNVPYVTNNVSATGAQTQTVTYVPEGITLTVTPTINSDGRITLNVNPSVTEPAASSLTNQATGAPGTNTRTAQTTIIVRDGETIVIGGLISDRNETTISKVPVLGDIPILGWLFKSKSITRVRTELLIFVTTKLLSD